MRIITIILISCVLFGGCSMGNSPKTWSELLKSTPKELQQKQENLKVSMEKLKNKS